MRKKILFVFGTRPEVIKMAPVIEEARARKGEVECTICVTAQHRRLLDQALGEFNIKPDIDLNLMRPDQTLQALVASVTKGLKGVYESVKPDLVLVQGDTSTVFAAALTAYYENIDIGHIEAGLRSRNLRNPFPEEINRRFVSLVARYNFCPTPVARTNLLKEAVDPKTIFITGNTVVDALKNIVKTVKDKPPRISGLEESFLEKPYILITGHRRENLNGGMKNVCMTIKALANRYPHLNWIWVAHLNPNTRRIVFGSLKGEGNVRVIEPSPYREFVRLMINCEFIISDSGGIQEEAPYLKKPVLVTRICTERPEAIKCGLSILVGTDAGRITGCVDGLLRHKNKYVQNKNPFGDGKASGRILDVILRGSCREFKAT